MKYPWTALSLIIIWLTTTYIILRTSSELNINFILLVTFIGTVVISFIGFKSPRISK